jgi:hypothetical protein
MHACRERFHAILHVARQDARIFSRQRAKTIAVDYFGPCRHRQSNLLKGDGALVFRRGIGEVFPVNVQEVSYSPDRRRGIISGFAQNKSNEWMIVWSWARRICVCQNNRLAHIYINRGLAMNFSKLFQPLGDKITF